jgi:hypothetical protein
LDARASFSEANPLPAFEDLVVGSIGFDDGAPLVAGGPEQFLEQGCGDALRVVLPVDHQEIDRADVTAGSNGWPEREDRATDDDTLRLRDDNARLREIDELAHQIGRSERALATVDLHRIIAQGDEPVDVRDTGCSDQVFHAVGSNLAGFGDQALDRVRSRRHRGPRSARWRQAMDRSRRAQGCGRPVLHSGRRWVIYGIASAATCAPPGCGTPTPPFVHIHRSRTRRQGGQRGIDRGTHEPAGSGTGSSRVVSTGDLEETE